MKREFQTRRLEDAETGHVRKATPRSESYSDDSDYSPAKPHTTLMGYKTDPVKRKKSTPLSRSRYFTPPTDRYEPEQDSLSKLSLFLTPNIPPSFDIQLPRLSDGGTFAEKLDRCEESERSEESEEERKRDRGVIAPLFPDLRHRKGSLASDRPVKVIGLREREGRVEYAVLFALSSVTCPDIAIISHSDLVAQVPWLFANFILSGCTF